MRHLVTTGMRTDMYMMPLYKLFQINKKRDFSVKSRRYFYINKKNVLSFIIKIPLSRGVTIHQFFNFKKQISNENLKKYGLSPRS
jgi:hypothetical protein